MRSSYIRRIVAALVFVLISGCVMAPPKPQRTQLQIREFQTRTYDNRGQTKRIMKAVIDVLQDDGYIIKNADRELGFITASRETDVEDPWESGFAQFSNGVNARYRKNAITECSVNISEYGKEVKVRAVFQNKVMDNFGGTLRVMQVEEPKFYQDFFAKVDKGIFIEKQDL